MRRYYNLPFPASVAPGTSCGQDLLDTQGASMIGCVYRAELSRMLDAGTHVLAFLSSLRATRQLAL